MIQFARLFFLFGILFLVTGGLLYLAARWGLPLGRLPGDIRIERGGFSLFFPLATCLVLSIVLSVILNVLARLLKK